MKRQIIHIDQEKCNGCGACAAACHEGAIAMIGGKATLMLQGHQVSSSDPLVELANRWDLKTVKELLGG